MNREQIEQAANDYAFENMWYPGETAHESDILGMMKSFADAFKDGADWRINSVWHDAKVTPNPFNLLLIEDSSGEYDIGYGIKKDTVRWAYVKDLIATKGGENEND